MKKLLTGILLLFSLQSFCQINSDSLWNVIESHDYSDSLKLEAYERITKHLLVIDPDSSRKVCRKGLRFSQKIGNYRFEWSFFNRIGRTYLKQDNFPETINYFLKSLEVAEMTKHTFTIAQ